MRGPAFDERKRFSDKAMHLAIIDSTETLAKNPNLVVYQDLKKPKAKV
jgi:hypothetical protein